LVLKIAKRFFATPIDRRTHRDIIRDPSTGKTTVEGQARLHLRQAVAGVSSKRNAVVIYRRRGFLEVFFEK